MKSKAWIWITMIIVLIVALVVTIVLVSRWYQSGNVRSNGEQVRVDLSGQAYIFDHETGEMIGSTMMTLYGETEPGNLEVFDGWMNIMNMDYMNQYDGTLTTTMGVLGGRRWISGNPRPRNLHPLGGNGSWHKRAGNSFVQIRLRVLRSSPEAGFPCGPGEGYLRRVSGVYRHGGY